MNSKLNNKLKGKKNAFTIIEVVLVLAIAGLIFLIVFLALPGLQRSRRDTQRKSDAGKVLSQLENYASNNNGNYPTTTATQTDFTSKYVNATDYKDPSTNTGYSFDWGGTAGTTTGTIYVGVGKKCSGTSFATGGSSVAIIVPIESGGAYCQGGN